MFLLKSSLGTLRKRRRQRDFIFYETERGDDKDGYLHKLHNPWDCERWCRRYTGDCRCPLIGRPLCDFCSQKAVWCEIGKININFSCLIENSGLLPK